MISDRCLDLAEKARKRAKNNKSFILESHQLTLLINSHQENGCDHQRYFSALKELTFIFYLIQWFKCGLHATCVLLFFYVFYCDYWF